MKIIKSKRKTLSLQVNNKGEVIVRAPFFCTSRQIENFIAKNQDFIISAKAKIKQKYAGLTLIDKDEIKLLKQKTKSIVLPLVNNYAKILSVSPSAVRITSATTRFGSCSGKNSLSFSAFLCLYPQELTEYIVLHELSHIKEHNHSKNFYGIIASVMPDYKQKEKALKNYPIPLGYKKKGSTICDKAEF